MAKARGSKKGTPAERKLCRLLSLWWSNGDNDFIFWRSDSSGAHATIRGKRGKDTAGQYGDICAVHSSGQPLIDLLVIEKKQGYSKETIAHILDKPTKNKPNQYQEWFAKNHSTVRVSGAYSWWLIHQRDRQQELIFMPFSFWQELTKEGVTAVSSEILLNTPKEGYVWGTVLEDFLQSVSPQHIKSLSKRV